MTASPSPVLRWGILATGKIAHQFAADLRLVPDARLEAVGSRSLASAEAFVTAYDGRPDAPGRARGYGSYEALVADPDVDIVYVATPHSRHLDDARLALEAGKHVLCEKPLTLRTSDAETLVALARERGLFLMEAMWTACHPTIIDVAARVRAGEFGRPAHLHAELGFVVPEDPTSRLLDPRLGAGALLDMGIYPLTFAHLMLGPAERITAQADVVSTEHGSYDASVVMTGRYAGGALATMAASMRSWSSRAAAIATDRGRLTFDDFHHPTRVVFTPHVAKTAWTDDERSTAPQELVGAEPVIGRGYGNEIVEVHRCVRAGLTESPRVPWEQTLTLMRAMDAIRAEVGVTYEV
ncbi:Gfo/Idh/MocA family oxidoreductase [Nocardioides sp.]|uniref:Gfo/Idh/MocA family protein n=1 Tax=Nocardioides sp. TaxID=35761 RepID=UPI002609AF6D|nr:Gfo/Idh/MocA family oxidoreductase [Nocardioides sp.]